MAEVIDAAQQALRLGDLMLGERLARSALERCDGLAARLALAHALAWRAAAGRPRRCWPSSTPPRCPEPELMAWTLLRAANQVWMLSEPERATASCGPSAVGSPMRPHV